jgi:hypothetical protein
LPEAGCAITIFTLTSTFQGGLKMDELIKLVTQKTGIPKEQAQAAVETVIKFLKEKLPGPVGSQIDGVLSGSGTQPQSISRKLGGLFGKK